MVGERQRFNEDSSRVSNKLTTKTKKKKHTFNAANGGYNCGGKVEIRLGLFAGGSRMYLS